MFLLNLKQKIMHFPYHSRGRNNGRSPVMSGQILAITCHFYRLDIFVWSFSYNWWKCYFMNLFFNNDIFSKVKTFFTFLTCLLCIWKSWTIYHSRSLIWHYEKMISNQYVLYPEQKQICMECFTLSWDRCETDRQTFSWCFFSLSQ